MVRPTPWVRLRLLAPSCTSTDSCTDKTKWLRIGQIGMLGLALWLMWATGSRSALVAFLTGLALMYYFYPKLIRGKILRSCVTRSLSDDSVPMATLARYNKSCSEVINPCTTSQNS